jgi:hypothetical protein
LCEPALAQGVPGFSLLSCLDLFHLVPSHCPPPPKGGRRQSTA